MVLLAVVDPGFPKEGGANHEGGCANLLFGQKFSKYFMKIKEFGLGGVHYWHRSPLDPPMAWSAFSFC